MGAKRLIVFFDWQNVYMRARDSFESPSSPANKGQANPVDLAHVLLNKHAARFPDDHFELEQIRVYRGRPTQQSDAVGYNAFQRQTSRWASNKLIRPIYNDLRYPSDWGEPTCTTSPREKGIDVALAVDVVALANDDEYDVGIIMSADYDLVPAINHVVGRRITRNIGPRLEVASWMGDQGERPLRIRLPNHNIWCTWLDRNDYWGVMDETDYKIKAESRTSTTSPKPGPPRYST